MKKTISMLFICTLALAACGPEEPLIALSCRRPKGVYALKGTILEVAPTPRCIQPQPGTDRSTTVPLLFDEEGNVTSNYKSYGAECTTAYSDDGCSVVAACSITYADGTYGETHSYRLSADGLTVTGRYALAGTGNYCSRAVIDGVGQKYP